MLEKLKRIAAFLLVALRRVTEIEPAESGPLRAMRFVPEARVVVVQPPPLLLELTACPQDEPAATAPVVAVPAQRPRSMFAARLRSVARLNGRKGRKPKLRGRTAAAAIPRAAAATKRMAKRSPTVFPVKRQAVKPKRAQTRIIDTRPKRRSAVIIRFPGAGAKPGTLRHVRAA